MATFAIDLSHLLQGIPAGAWVAISEKDERVVAYAADLQTVIKLAHERGELNPLIVRVPEQSSVMFF
ncbi:MAG: DUF5678 domain-containing protein [Acidobacteriota bacterium]